MPSNFMKRIFLVLAACMILVPYAFSLTNTEYSVNFYTKENPGDNPDVLCLLDTLEETSAVIYQKMGEWECCYLASPIESQCEVFFYQVTPMHKVGHNNWRYEYKSDKQKERSYFFHMCISEEPEIKHSDESFVHVSAYVSPEKFRVIDQSWSEMISSKKFDDLLSAKFYTPEMKELFIKDLNNTEQEITINRISGHPRFFFQTPVYKIKADGNMGWSITCKIKGDSVKYTEVSRLSY